MNEKSTTPVVGIEDMLIDISLRDGISVDEVLTLTLRWVYPLTWRQPSAIALAFAGGEDWQGWRAHHNELMASGYRWPLLPA